MIGSIIGDIVGSIYEFNNIKTKEFPLFSEYSEYTDDTREEVLRYAQMSAVCTHNHPEGIKGAQAVALCIFMARQGATKDLIKSTIEHDFGYDLSLSIDQLRPRYSWDGLDDMDGATCQGSVPEAIRAFIDGNDFEDSIRNAISIGGDSDTIGCITGAIAEAFYGVPEQIAQHAYDQLPNPLRNIVTEFETKYTKHIISIQR